MELRHLRYFQAVAEELSYSGAARRLHIAQPALSRAVKELESSIGVVLLRRDRRTVSRKLALPASIRMSSADSSGRSAAICWSTAWHAVTMMMMGRGGRMAATRSRSDAVGMTWLASAPALAWTMSIFRPRRRAGSL